jgi:adenine-specific DNA methylase
MMNVTAPEKTEIVPFSLKDAPSLIEKAWPTAKISAETQKERKAGPGQTLTGLGSYWKGRKPLILTRACVLAALMPATDDLERDVEIFEKLMGMADETFGRRFVEGPAAFSRLFPDHANQVIDYSGTALRWRDDLTDKERQRRITKAFMELPYVERLNKVKRPEEVAEVDLLYGVWDEVNAHLGTTAKSIQELVEQLGIMRFGRRPKVADTFAGSGSIPFEAARMGCDVIASDLNPVACMLTWGSFNIVGSDPKKYAAMKRDQERVVAEIDAEISAMGIEHDSKGNRGKAYLYCLETRCPRTGYMVPMLPTRVLSSRRFDAIVELNPDHENRRYDITVRSSVSKEEIAEASEGTVRSGRLYHEVLDDPLGVSIKEIRGDFKDEERVNRNRLRFWENADIRARPDDIWQERLYAILWMSGDDLRKGKAKPKSWFAAPTEEDLTREEEVAAYVERHLVEWQEAGLVPDMEIEPGYNTSQPIRERAWTHWHHLFNSRHLLLNAIAAKYAKKYPHTCFGLASLIDRNARTSRWDPARETAQQTFTNQAINTMLNYPARGWLYASPFFDLVSLGGHVKYAGIRSSSAVNCDFESDVFITDPPYADAVQYDEISEFFISWLRKNPPPPFDEWIWDSRRNVAIKGDGQPFKAAMIDAYSSMTENMSDNGLQIVQFTHQDAKTWSDMAQIFWGAGLQVVQDWYVSTETTSELRKGGYVQGTHMIVLKKRQGDQSGYQDEIVHEIRDEVERQIKEMIGLNDQMDAARGENIFNDADLQMAGYAAALRVLTAYTKIDGVDMTREALRPRKKGDKTLVDELTEFAVQTANEFLVPEGLERDLWLELNGAERFYLKMMDIEEAGEAKLDQFQNFAKAFRVGDYDDMMASKSPNNAKLKTAIKLGKTSMAEGIPFGRDSIVRLALRGIWRVAKEDEVDEVLEELRELIPDYLRKRDTLRQIIAYVAAKREHAEPDEASAARILGTAIQTERI